MDEIEDEFEEVSSRDWVDSIFSTPVGMEATYDNRMTDEQVLWAKAGALWALRCLTEADRPGVAEMRAQVLRQSARCAP